MVTAEWREEGAETRFWDDGIAGEAAVLHSRRNEVRKTTNRVKKNPPVYLANHARTDRTVTHSPINSTVCPVLITIFGSAHLTT